MRNFTVTLDENTAAWVRVHAARRNMSLPHFIGELLRSRMREYERAMRRYLARKPDGLSQPSEPYPVRDDLHARQDLR